MKKSIFLILTVLPTLLIACDSTNIYNITSSAWCNFVNGTISCPENNIQIPDNIKTDMYTEGLKLGIHKYENGIIFCELDLQNATDICRDEQGNLIDGIIKNYDKESGNLLQESIYKNGKNVKSIGYHKNGIVSSESTPDGLLRAYNNKGQLIYETELSEGKIVLKNYDANGNITSTEILPR